MSSIDQPTSKKLWSENAQDFIDEVNIDFVFHLLAHELNEFFDVEFVGYIMLHHPFLLLLHPPLLLIVVQINFYGFMMNQNFICNFWNSFLLIFMKQMF
jgi:hypothetical protein